MVKLQGVGMKV